MLKIGLSLTILTVGLIGCTEKSISATRSDNPNIKVEHLVTIDGCKVYRFMDDRYVYVTVCPGKTTYPVSCGKNCTRMESIDTVENYDQ